MDNLLVPRVHVVLQFRRPDAQEAATFYQKVFGFQRIFESNDQRVIVWEGSRDSSVMSTIFMQHGNQTFEVCDVACPADMSFRGNMGIRMYTADIIESTALAEGAGANLIRVDHSQNENLWHVRVADQWELTWSLVSMNHLPPAVLAIHPMLNLRLHVLLYVPYPNAQLAAQFYERSFGFQRISTESRSCSFVRIVGGKYVRDDAMMYTIYLCFGNQIFELHEVVHDKKVESTSNMLVHVYVNDFDLFITGLNPKLGNDATIVRRERRLARVKDRWDLIWIFCSMANLPAEVVG